MTKEIWKPVEGFDYPYEVSNLGRVRGNYGLIGGSHNGVALTASLMRNGRTYTVRVHTLVARAFVPQPEGMNMVRHKDGNVDNCCADNLEWFSYETMPKKEKVTKEAKKKVPKCPLDCIYNVWCDTNLRCCDYYLTTGNRRPCPAGKGCTVYVSTGQKKRNTWNDGKRKEDGNV